jgi:FtsH-binding integral membrane protein
MDNPVWERSGYGTMSKNLFVLMVSFWTAVGLAGSAIAAYFSQSWGISWLLVIGVLVVSIIGTIIALTSDNPLVSLFGYELVAISLGLLLGPFVALYTTASVVRIFFITTAVVVVLGVVGAVIPDNLEGWGSWLLGGLIILLVGYFIVPIASIFGLPIGHALTILDWAGVLIFSAYVIYDWNRAMRVPYTADNAIDCALAVYLDFVNLFIRLLELTGKKRD